jgi:hypothetical protein
VKYNWKRKCIQDPLHSFSNLGPLLIDRGKKKNKKKKTKKGRRRKLVNAFFLFKTFAVF